MLLRLLGMVSVGADDLSLVPVPGTVLPAVLAHLALAEGRHVSVDALADRVWDSPPESARNSLQVAVLKLRKQVGYDLLESGRGRYRLRTDLIRVDWAEVEQLVGHARSSLERGSAAAACTAALDGVARFAGAPLASLTSVASVAARERMVTLRREAVSLGATALLQLGRAAEAVTLLRHEIEREPLSEPAHVLLMQALSADGRPAEALGAYADFRDRLADELGIDPAPATTRAFTAILDGTMPPGAATLSAGATRQPDRRVRLPQPAAPLVGRDRDLERIDRLLASGDRLVTLVGHGGIGKTHLAVVAARAVAEKSGREAFFVDLASCSSSADVTAAIALAAEVHGERLTDVTQALAGRPSVVLLDNAEQVVDGVADACPVLLENVDLCVLVTSRVRLQLRQERVVDVGPLDVEHSDSPAVALLAARADDPPLPVLLGLARRTSGIPLLLELVASALRWQSAEELAAQLDGSLSRLRDRSRDRPTRQSDLGTVIEWSLDHLAPAGRVGLHHLTVVHGPFDRPLGLALLHAGEPDAVAEDTFAELVDVGLVQRVSSPGELRFRILEPIRGYVANRAALGIPDAVTSAYARHFLARLAAADARTPDTQLPMTQLVRHEEPNLTGALEWALTHDTALAMTGLGALLTHWSSLGRWDAVLHWSRRALARPDGTAAERAQVTLCELSALLGSGRASADELRARIEPLREVIPSLEPHWYHRSIRMEVELALLEGDLAAALEWTRRYRPSGPMSRYSAISHRVNVLSALGAWEESLETLLPLLDDPGLSGNPLQHASVLNNVGFAASQLGDYDLADRVLTDAIALSRSNGQTELSLIVLVNHAWVALDRGDPSRALIELADALEEFPEIRHQPVDMAEIATIGALALHRLGRSEDAPRVAAYARAAVATDPARFDPNMHERTRALGALVEPVDPPAAEAVVHLVTRAARRATTDQTYPRSGSRTDNIDAPLMAPRPLHQPRNTR